MPSEFIELALKLIVILANSLILRDSIILIKAIT